MIITEQEAIERVAEQTVRNKERWSQTLKQRRHQVVDMYGVEYTRAGDANNPARFYISISPDMVYLERFEFKLIINPFLSTGGSMTSAVSLTVSGGGSVDCITNQEIDSIVNSGNSGNSGDSGNSGNSGEEGSVSPNPHAHSIIPGITSIPTTASDFRVRVEGIDVTPYLIAQYGSWIHGQGVYPSLDIGKDYDLLEVASDMVGEGRTAQADAITHPGYKAIEITSGSPFTVTLVNYLKYSHLNR